MDILETKWWSWSIIKWVHDHMSSLKGRQQWRLTWYFMRNISPIDYAFIPHVYSGYISQRIPVTPYKAFWRTYFYFAGLQNQKSCMARRPSLFSPTHGEIYDDTRHLKDGGQIIHYPVITLDIYEGSIFE